MYNESDVTKDLVASQIQEQLRAMGITGDEDAKKPDPIKINLGGQEYAFNSREEMETTLNNTFAAVTQQQAAVLAQLEEATKQQNLAQQNQNSPAAPVFNQEHFVKLITENPMAAFDYVDEMRYGPEKISPKIKQELAEVEEMRNTLTAYRFLNAHPEFHNDNANANQLRGIANSLGLKTDYAGLESAYQVGRANGMFQPQAPPENQGRFAQNSPSVPPTINRGGNSLPDQDVEAYMNGLSNAQLQAILEGGS